MGMELTVHELQEALPFIQEMLIAKVGIKLIRIDGHSGAGKSTLATMIANGERRVCRLDTYLDHVIDGRSFADRIDRAGIATRISEIADAGSLPIFEGIRADEFLPAGAFGPELRIYLSNLSPYDNGADRRNRTLGTTEYHAIYEPRQKADLVVSLI